MNQNTLFYCRYITSNTTFVPFFVWVCAGLAGCRNVAVVSLLWVLKFVEDLQINYDNDKNRNNVFVTEIIVDITLGLDV